MKSSHTTHKNDLPAKSPSASAVTMTEMVLPSDTNALGTIFGGTPEVGLKIDELLKREAKL
jgi:hypothetical protein